MSETDEKTVTVLRWITSIICICISFVELAMGTERNVTKKIIFQDQENKEN